MRTTAALTKLLRVHQSRPNWCSHFFMKV